MKRVIMMAVVRLGSALLISSSFIACGQLDELVGNKEDDTPRNASQNSESGGGDDETSDLPSREPANDNFPYAGLVRVDGGLRCSGVLLKHGVFVSARHCFSSAEESGSSSREFTITFPSEANVRESDTEIVVTDIVFDASEEGVNDIAYLLYDGEQTNGVVTVLNVPINTSEVVSPGTLMTTVGYPITEDRSLLKLMTKDCKRLDREGVIDPKPRDPGYSGVLYDTDCYAWMGNSGGGFFSVKYEEGVLIPLSLEGVVTHTFEQTELGDIDPDFIESDEFGVFVKTVNYSAFKDAIRLDEFLAR